MIGLMVNTIMDLFMTIFWVMFKIIQLAGGLLIGNVRTRDVRSSYHPKALCVPFDLNAEPQIAFAIVVPRTTVWQPDQAVRFVSSLWTQGRVMLQIVAESSGISFRVVYLDPVNDDAVERQIYAFYPDAQIKRVPYVSEHASSPNSVVALPLIQANMFPAPGMTVDQIKYFDPLTTLTQAISHLQAGERIVYSVAVLADAVGANNAGIKMVTVSDIHPLAYTSMEGIYIAEMRKSQGYDRIPRFEWDVQRILHGKLNNPLYHVIVFLSVQSPTVPRARQLAGDVLPHLMQFANEPFNALVPPKNENEIEVWTETSADEEDLKWNSDVYLFLTEWADVTINLARWRSVVNVLQAEEIAALWHVPYDSFTAPAIDWLTARQVPMPKAIRERRDGIHIGTNRSGGQTYGVYLPDDDRTLHIALIGKTGTGKSTLMHRLITNDIKKGRGVCVVDPHGSLVQTILQTSIPSERREDVVILDVMNQVDGAQYPPPLNLLSRPAGVAGDIAAGMLMSILTKIYEGFGETQMAHTLHMALLTLAQVSQPTLLDIARLFEDAEFRDRVIATTDNFVVRRFWAGFLAKSPAQQEQMVYPVLRRLDSFYNNNALLAMTCHPNPLNFVELIQQNKIILVSLAADEARIPSLERLLLGSVLVSQIQMAAMAGAVTQSPYLLYMDEAQHFVTTALPKMLSESRKHGLGLVLANQYFHQLAGDTLEALEGNVGAFFAFETGERDAHALSLYMKPEFQPADLVMLGKYRAVLSRYG